MLFTCCFCFKQKTAYELRISDWRSDVCSSDLSSLEARDAATLARMVDQGERDIGLLLRGPAAALAGKGDLGPRSCGVEHARIDKRIIDDDVGAANRMENGRAPCRERVCQDV